MKRFPLALLLVVALLPAAGCETSFEPFAEETRFYSIHGYLSDARSVQQIRIEALQDGPLLGGGGDTLDARMTLEEVSTGRQVTMRNRYAANGGANAGARVFVTSEMDIEPGASYRLTARRSDGATSTVRTAVPEAFSVPQRSAPIEISATGCGQPPDPEPLIFMVSGIERLVGVEAVYYYAGEQRPQRNAHLADTMQVSGGIEVSIPWSEDVGPCASGVEAFEVDVFEGAEDWPDYAGLGQQGGVGGVLSNVTGGVGYVGGVHGETVEVPILRLP